MRLINADRGAVAVEFAFVAPVFFYLVFAVIELSVKAIQQNELDNFMMFAYQELATSPVQSANGQEHLAHLCEIGPIHILSCDDIVLGAEVVPGRFLNLRSTLINGQWDFGCANDVVVLEMLYPVTNIFHPFVLGDVVSLDGDGNDMFRSRGVVRREPLLNNGGLC